jgi:hypothetical protein
MQKSKLLFIQSTRRHGSSLCRIVKKDRASVGGTAQGKSRRAFFCRRNWLTDAGRHFPIRLISCSDPPPPPSQSLPPSSNISLTSDTSPLQPSTLRTLHDTDHNLRSVSDSSPYIALVCKRFGLGLKPFSSSLSPLLHSRLTFIVYIRRSYFPPFTPQFHDGNSLIQLSSHIPFPPTNTHHGSQENQQGARGSGPVSLAWASAPIPSTT